MHTEWSPCDIHRVHAFCQLTELDFFATSICTLYSVMVMYDIILAGDCAEAAQFSYVCSILLTHWFINLWLINPHLYTLHVWSIYNEFVCTCIFSTRVSCVIMCEAINKRSPVNMDYYTGSHPVSWSQKVKYLGIIISSKLKGGHEFMKPCKCCLTNRMRLLKIFVVILCISRLTVVSRAAK